MSTPSRSNSFFRYAAAATAALGAAASAKAQFVGSYGLTPPSAGTFNNSSSQGTFGSWTTLQAGTTTLTTSSGASLILFSSGAVTNSNITILSTAAASGTVSYALDSVAVGTGTHELYYTADGSTYYFVTSSSANGYFDFSVANGATFGFRVVANYLNSMQVTFTNFSASSAVPEPGATSLLAGCAALGFVGLMAHRAKRRRAVAV